VLQNTLTKTPSGRVDKEPTQRSRDTDLIGEDIIGSFLSEEGKVASFLFEEHDDGR
jgi:hypothetical protein